MSTLAPPAPASPDVDRATPDVERAPRRATSGTARGQLARLFLGPDADPRWARPGLWALLIATAITYLTNITISGYANEFYAASVKSATQSWTALLWASLDSNLSITVDKPPAAIWVMGLSARLFGFSSASLLIPQALMGVATVALVYGAVRRVSGPGAGLVGGALVTLTPVAALMFRFDNPDALLTLTMTGAGYAVVRALQTTRGRRALGWLVLAGWLVGLAFLTKMLQGLLILPALGLAYLLFAPRSWRARIGHLLAAAASLIVSAGWLIALCAVWPASARPYIGGSTNNSLWDLALGYNGLGRILGGSGNGGGMGGSSTNTGFGGATGLLRMFNASFGTEISWFLPAALLLLVAGLVARGLRPRTDVVRASLVLWGGSMLITAVVFSFMSGTVHAYYAVALAPSIAATVAIGGAALLKVVGPRGRLSLLARAVLALAVAGTAAWGFVLLTTYAASWLPALRWVALAGGIGGALVWFVAGLLGDGLAWRRVAAAALVAGALASVAPSGAWTIATAASAHSGSIPTSGPAVAGGSGMGGAPMGTPPGQSSGTTAGSTTSQTSGAAPPGAPTGGMQGGTSSNAELVALLNGAGTKWSAAVVGDQTAAGLILSTHTAIYCIGGWSGSDNNISLDEFKALVAAGQIHYFVSGGQGGGGPQGGSSGSASEITSWVTSTFSSTTVGGQTVYDLTAAK